MSEAQIVTSPLEPSETVLEIRRTFKVPRERVYRAWVESGEVQNWWGPKGYSCTDCEWDARVGGTYRNCMKTPEGNIICVGGTFQEVTPPERLVFTWRWENTDGPTHGAETLVTVEFKDLGESTEIMLMHERFPNAEARDAHRNGWSKTFDSLEEHF